jgi:hypothetical protein
VHACIDISERVVLGPKSLELCLCHILYPYGRHRRSIAGGGWMSLVLFSTVRIL